MHTIIPGFDILKTVTDTNISGDAAEQRRKAFDVAVDLKSRPAADVDILLDGNVFGRVAPRLNDRQSIVFRQAFRIDESATGLSGLNHNGGIKFIATVEQRARKVIILTENVGEYASISTDRVIAVTPEQFIARAQAAMSSYDKGIISNFPDAIAAEFFLKRQ
jgi:hypothetical protein